MSWGAARFASGVTRICCAKRAAMTIPTRFGVEERAGWLALAFEAVRVVGTGPGRVGW